MLFAIFKLGWLISIVNYYVNTNTNSLYIPFHTIYRSVNKVLAMYVSLHYGCTHCIYVPQALRQLMCHAYTPACVQCAIGHNISICMHSHDLQYSCICIIYTAKLMIKASYVGENFWSFYKFSTNHENLLACAVVQF